MNIEEDYEILDHIAERSKLDTNDINILLKLSKTDNSEIKSYIAELLVRSYGELRNNVEFACKERKYQFESSYGHGNNKFKNNVQKITVYLFGKLDGESIGGVNILMSLKKIGLFKFEIVSLECDEAIFEYLFYGNKQ